MAAFMASITAQKWGTSKIGLNLELFTAINGDEVTGQAMRKALEIMPVNEGWFNHNVVYVEVSIEALRELMQDARTTYEMKRNPC